MSSPYIAIMTNVYARAIFRVYTNQSFKLDRIIIRPASLEKASISTLALNRIIISFICLTFSCCYLCKLQVGHMIPKSCSERGEIARNCMHIADPATVRDPDALSVGT